MHDNDIMDLRDLADKWDEAIQDHAEASETDDDNWIADAAEEIAKYVGLADSYGVPMDDPDDMRRIGNSYEPTLIAEDYFAEYAEEFAKDIGAINGAEEWPACHIDWDAAANALKMDYTAVEFDGRTYYTRQF